MVKLVRLAQAHETQAPFPVGFRSAQFILKDPDAHGCSFIHQSHITRPSHHIHRVLQISAAPFLHAGYGHDILRCFLEPAGKFLPRRLFSSATSVPMASSSSPSSSHTHIFRNQLRRKTVHIKKRRARKIFPFPLPQIPASFPASGPSGSRPCLSSAK